MEILDNLYRIVHKNNYFNDRKLSINSKKTIINGVKKSGKTSLIIDYLHSFNQDEILYIDLKDIRVDKKYIAKNIEEFINNKPIKILIIENFDKSFEIPNIEHIILTSCDAIKGFETLVLYPLDFEEFISFNTRHSSIEHIFQLYINSSSYPQIALNSSGTAYNSMQDMLRLMLYNEMEFEIFRQLSETQGLKISLFQVYNILKQSMKISKDSLYKIVNKLQNENMIFLVKKYGSSRSQKKLFLADFAFKNALSFKKDFLKVFENMIFLELMKKEHAIYYTNKIDLYVPKNAYGVLSIPFLPKEMIKLRLQKIVLHVQELGLKKIDIITVGNEGEFWLKNIKCSILPFWEWALKD